ncbi:trypsin I-P1 [Pseudomyrmex gracilis]|uniref:trypsin I-P1 n=1 Tax=Pseudomyrmex gracilis TaxID=219809 RepID=UPI0009959725|nr:trypsin I-P1 [Pseudomyrmex gracilis]
MNVLLFALSSCQLLQHALVFAQVTFDTTMAATTRAAGQCQCYPGGTCPSGTGGIDVRIVNQGTLSCPSGYVLCCNTGGGINDASCGVRKIAPSPHPVGQAAYGAYPWQVALLTSNNGYIGGGVLITPTHVLTVAHKVYNVTAIKARLGAWDLQSTTEGHVDIAVSRITVHPDFNKPVYLANDIAVLKLSSAAPIATNNNVNTVCVPSSAIAAGTKCEVAGWGKDAFATGQYQNILKQVDVSVVSLADCQTALRKTRLSGFFNLDSSFMCAGGEAGKDACTGDGGSALVCSVNGGAYQAVGLVAWGIGCADSGVPGVYVDVSRFFPWITQQLT